MHLFMSLAECWLARGHFDRSRAFADQCLEVATRTDSRKFIAAGWRLRGEVARVRRQWDEADAALREAVAPR